MCVKDKIKTKQTHTILPQKNTFIYFTGRLSSKFYYCYNKHNIQSLVEYTKKRKPYIKHFKINNI